MEYRSSTMSPKHRMLLWGFILVMVCYYFTMDVILYSTIQSVDSLVTEKKAPGQSWSPFRPLSVKLIMQDPTTHYIITPISEYFNEFTHFSDVFYFITPNMITFTHLALSFVSAKLVFSDSLKSRRIGCVIFEIRSLLDAFDGTVFRSRAANKRYESHHNELGFWVDSVSDTIGGFLLSFAVVFMLWWKCPPRKEVTSLPWTMDDKNGVRPDIATEKHETRTFKYYSKKFIFWRCFCFCSQIGISSAMWDQTAWKLNDIFTTQLEDPTLMALQTTALHSAMISLIFWGWRLLEGQALQHYFLVAIFTDKVWEFLRFAQYVGLVAIAILTVISMCQITQIRHTLQMVSTS